MSYINFDDQTLENQAGETVLDTLTRSGFERPFRCRKGVCQTCIMQVTNGAPPKESQTSLNAAQIALGYFLPCSCLPTEDLTIQEVGVVGTTATTRVIELHRFNNAVLRIRCEPTLGYRPGQFVTVINADNIGRSYSLASCPQMDNFIEFQIKHYDNGQFSEWAFNRLQVGDTLRLEGPYGHCIYTQAMADRDLLLVAMGTGLAPLYGVIKEALISGHTKRLDLVIAAKRSSQLYLLEELSALKGQYSQLHLSIRVQEIDSEVLLLEGSQPTLPSVEEGNIYDYIKSEFPDLSGRAVFLCGAESFVRKLRKQSFMAGAKMNEIFVDGFSASG